MRELNLTHLSNLGAELGAELDEVGLPREIGLEIVDQLVCASAPTAC